MLEIQFRNEIVYRRTFVVFVTLFTISCTMWISLDKLHVLGTKERLDQAFVSIGAFAQNEGFLPDRIGDLRVFFPEENLRDTSGNPFSYAKLTDLTYVLRGFGPEETLADPPHLDRKLLVFVHPDKAKESWSQLSPERSPTFFHPLYRVAPKLNKPGKLLANLSTITTTGATRLLVTINSRSHFYVAHSRHRAVEEFTWLPGGKRLLYTASDDGIRTAGVYLWDLGTNEETRIYPKAGVGESADHGRNGLMAYSLSGFSQQDKTFLIQVWNGAEFNRKGRDPIAKEQHLRLKIAKKGVSVVEKRIKKTLPPASSIQIDKLENASSTYAINFPPSIDPPWLNAIDEWQTYSAGSSSLSVSQAGVWLTMNLYICALQKRGPTNRNSPLGAFATELAQAVINAPGLPLYQKLQARRALARLKNANAQAIGKNKFCPNA